MTNIKLQSILIPTNEVCQVEQMYYHRSSDESAIDFDGYFNLFYIGKHKKYTNIKGLVLNIRVSGISKISLMHDREVIQTFDIEDSSTNNEFVFPYSDYDEGVFWFRAYPNIGIPVQDNLDGLNSIDIRASFWGIVDKVKHIKLLADICTYKREEYLYKNLKKMVEFLSELENEYIYPHVSFLIVDNGKTIKNCGRIQELLCATDNIEIIENRNTGGAGGFTRGIIEAIQKKESENLTHVVLMDDDATYELDSIIRLYGILATLKEEYKDLTIGGAMWRSDYPYIQHACGEWYRNHAVYNYRPFIDLRSFEECTQDYMLRTDMEYEMYSGWWLCCYSLNVANMNNLPLSQFFVHLDDVEYGVRNRRAGNPIAFFNGIGVWHKSFDLEFAGWKKYYDIRNDLYLTSLIGSDAEKKESLKYIRKQMTGQLFNMRYLEMYLTFLATKDFQKGWEWLNNLDVAEHHQKICSIVKKHVTKVDVEDISVANKAEIDEIIQKNLRGFPYEELMEYKPNDDKEETNYANNVFERTRFTLKKILLNGWILPPKKGLCVITPATGLWKNNFRYQGCLFVAFGESEGIIRTRSYKQIYRFIEMYSHLKQMHKKT